MMLHDDTDRRQQQQLLQQEEGESTTVALAQQRSSAREAAKRLLANSSAGAAGGISSSSGSSLSSSKHERSDKRRSRSFSGPLSSNPEGWHLRENLLWLWGGSPFSGVLCTVASALCYSLMGILVRLFAVQSLPPFETVAVRCGVMAVLSGACLAALGQPMLGSRNIGPLLLARGAVGFLALAAFFLCIQVLPVKDATFLSFTAPVFALALATVFLDERASSRDITGTACSLLGSLMVIQPPLVFGGVDMAMANAPFPASAAAIAAAAGALQRRETLVGFAGALLSGALSGAGYCITRAIGKAGEHPLTVVLVFSVVVCTASLLLLLLSQDAVVPTSVELGGMVVVGAVAFAAQVLLTRGLQLERAGKASAMQYIKVVGTHVLAVLFLSEQPSLAAAVGVTLICASLVYLAQTDKEAG